MRTTSNSVNYHDRLIRTYSNAWTPLMRTTSNSVNYHDRLIRTYSNAWTLLMRTNSNAIFVLNENSPGGPYLRTTSNATNYHDRLIRTYSNAWTPLMRTNSNSIKSLDSIVRDEIIGNANLAKVVRTCSNAWTPLMRTTSNSSIYHDRLIRTYSNAWTLLMRTTSNAALNLQTQLDAIDGGPADITISSDYSMSYDFCLSINHRLSVTNSVTINGYGHSITFARKADDRGYSNIFTIADGATVTLENVVLKDFREDAITVGTGGKLLFGEGVYIELAEGQTLARDWTFNGNAVINSYGNTIDLGSHTIGVVQPQHTLTIQDTTLTGLKTNNVRCVGNNATITFKDSNLLLSNNYSVTCGALNFERDVVMTGTNEFAYNSTQPATIATESSLFLDTGTTFKYAPTSSNRDLIVMEDVTSKLYLNGCTLNTTMTGMRLTKGSVIVDHKNVLENEVDGVGATKLSQGFGFGNGVVADDLTIHMMPGAMLDLTSGILDYENSVS